MSTAAKTRIRLGHSPDPDDAFMFYALAKDKISHGNFVIEHVVEDIESLNQRALKGELEVTAVSCHAYAYLANRYQVMSAGSSVGDQYGPILVCPKEQKNQYASPKHPDIRGKKIGVPGKLTTAYLTLQLYEKDFEPIFIPFDQIFDAVHEGRIDLGLIIHEGQITYGQNRLEKILDLGVWWYEKHQLPLPLGVDVIRRDLGEETVKAFAKLFKDSIQYALAHRQEALEYALEFGRGISRQLGDDFVGMYVNDRTVDLGTQGLQGFQKLLDEAYRRKILAQPLQLDVLRVQ